MSRFEIFRIERNLLNGESTIQMRFLTEQDGATITVGLQDNDSDPAAMGPETTARIKAKAKALLLEAAEGL
jgi:hypothetical protein